jgi:hypothetical protein
MSRNYFDDQSLHALEVFTTTLIATFEETPDQQRTTTLTCLQILNQAELVEETGAELVKGTTNQSL